MTHILKIHLSISLCWGIQACYPYRGRLICFIILSDIPNKLLLAIFIFLKLVHFRQCLVPLLVKLKTEWLRHEKYASKTHPDCQKVGFSHILHLSFIDLIIIFCKMYLFIDVMIIFCEMYLFRLEALMQIYHKTLLFVVLGEKNIFYYTFLDIYYIQYTYWKNLTFEILFSLQMT